MNIKICFFTVAVLLACHAVAQRSEKTLVDSMEMVLAKAKNDTQKVAAYADAMIAHLYYQPEAGLRMQLPAMELAVRLNWLPGIAKINHSTGRLYWRQGNFTKALQYHTIALAQYQQTNNKTGAGKVLIEIGQDYLDSGSYAQAKVALYRALQFNEANKDTTNILRAYDKICYLYDLQGDIVQANNIAYEYLKLGEKVNDKPTICHAAYLLGSSYDVLGNKKEALKYFRQGLKISIETGDQIDQINFHNSIAENCLDQHDYPKSLQHYLAAFDIVNELKDAQMMGFAYRSLGHYYRITGDYTKALQYLQSAASAYSGISNKHDLAWVYTEMGAAYTSQKNYTEAKKYFEKSKNIYDMLKSEQTMGTYYNSKQRYDSATGNWQSAYLHYKKFIAINDSASNKETLKKLVASQLQYDNEKKEAAAKAEQEKKDLLASEEIKRQRNIRNVSFAVLVLVGAFSVFAYRQRNKLAKEKKRSDQLLADKELLLREIHHRVKNNLEIVSSLLALQSAQIDDPHTKDAMLEGQNRVQSIGIVHQKLYQGTSLGSIEMKDYFINLSENILDSFGADKKVTIECAMEKLDIDIDTAVPLGLIVNELLTNTLKYAFPDGKPGTVTINLQKQKNGLLQLMVSDNGVGKSGTTKGTGFGGQLVSLLTQQLGGTMKEEIKNGTTVYFEFKTGKAA